MLHVPGRMCKIQTALSPPKANLPEYVKLMMRFHITRTLSVSGLVMRFQITDTPNLSNQNEQKPKCTFKAWESKQRMGKCDIEIISNKHTNSLSTSANNHPILLSTSREAILHFRFPYVKNINQTRTSSKAQSIKTPRIDYVKYIQQHRSSFN